MEPETDSIDLNRRDFLIRTAKASISVAATCAVGFGFHDPKGPTGRAETGSNLSIPDFSVPGVPPLLAVVRGKDRTTMLRDAMGALGGIGRFISRNDRVLLKVNAAFASPPALGATSHPEIVSELVRLCIDAGAASVTVTDNPINDPASCFALTGIGEAARSAGGRIVLPEPRLFESVTVNGARLIRDWPVLYGPIREADKLIGVAPVKDHHRSGASMIMKNWYGLLGGRRNVFHQDIHRIISELALMIRPTLVVLDGTETLMTNGPTGGALSDLKRTGTLIAGTDQVAADAFGARLLGKSVNALPFISMAAEIGAGSVELEPIETAPARVG